MGFLPEDSGVGFGLFFDFFFSNFKAFQQQISYFSFMQSLLWQKTPGIGP